MTPAEEGYHAYRVGEPHGFARNPLKAIIAPRPIAWVSTLSAGGVGNLAPYSFFNMINDAPPMVMFSSVGHKDSVRNIEETGEFTVSIVAAAQAAGMNVTSNPFPPEVDEFDAAGCARAPAIAVRPPGVAGSPAILECRCVEVKRLRGLDGNPLDTWMVIGEIVAVQIDRGCLADGLFRTERAAPLTRAGYADEYWLTEATGLYRMPRNRAPG